MDEVLHDDGVLLKRFVASGEEAPFNELVRRHGAFVFGVCCRVLGQTQDAEDAAQAVFLTLASKARSLGSMRCLAGWLHHVAWNISLRAQQAAESRRRREREAGAMIEARRDSEADSGEWAQLKPLLDTELQALPEKYRLPLILHHVEGRSQEEIATLLGCTYGTVSGRLNRARELFRERLARKGVTMAPAVVFLLISNHATVAMPAALIASTGRAAALMAAGHLSVPGPITAHAKALSEGATRAMFIAKMKIAAGVVVAVGVFASGITAFVSARAADSNPKPTPQVAVAAPVKPVAPKPVAGNDPPAPRPAEPAANPADPEIDGWIAQLGSADAGIHKAAMKNLRDAGERARPALEAASKNGEGDVKSRATTLAGVLKTEPLLKQISETVSKVTSYEADLKMTMLMGGTPMNVNGHIKAVPAKTHYIYDAALNFGPLTMPQHTVCDGTTIWSETTIPTMGTETRKMVIKMPMKEGDDDLDGMGSKNQNPADFANYAKQFDFIDAKEETVDGKVMYVLSGVVREDYLERQLKTLKDLGAQAEQMGASFLDSTRTSVVQISKDDSLVRKVEVKDDKGVVIHTIIVDNVKVNQKIEDALFIYCPPAGATVMDSDMLKNMMKGKAPDAAPAPAPDAKKETPKPKEF